MKIFEIVLPQTQYSAGNILKRAGYKKLGNGRYGNAYAKPNTPYILKLFEKDDQAYFQYLKLITTISNPHFPIVKGKPHLINNEYYAVRLETLTELPTSYYPLGRACSKYAQKYDELKNKTDLQYKNQKNPNSHFNNRKTKSITDFSHSQLTVFEDAYPDLAEALRLIVDHVIRPHRHHIDMHPGNFLLRGSTIVITDPATGHVPAIDLPDELKSPKQQEFPWQKTTPKPSASTSSPPPSDAINVFDPPWKPEDTPELITPYDQGRWSTHTWDTHTPSSTHTPTHSTNYNQSPNDWWNKDEHNEMAHKLFRKSWDQLNWTERLEIKQALNFHTD